MTIAAIVRAVACDRDAGGSGSGSASGDNCKLRLRWTFKGRAAAATPWAISLRLRRIASGCMWDRIWDAWRWIIVRINNFETQEWVIAFAILLTIGFLCMQGLGSRKIH